MASRRDKDYHKLRNPEKYFGCNLHQWIQVDGTIVNVSITSEYAKAQAAFDKIHYKYGGKSMVGDKRRRNTTRKSNQKDKQTSHQIERAKLKIDLRNLIESSNEKM